MLERKRDSRTHNLRPNGEFAAGGVGGVLSLVHAAAGQLPLVVTGVLVLVGDGVRS